MENEVFDDTAEDSSVNAAQRIFHALSSAPRRKILAYLSASGLTAGEIADRFSMSKPAVSQHLSILETAGLIRREKQGQFVHYSLIENNLVNTLNGFVQEVCPVGRPIKKESQARARAKDLP
ncbi:MULTISPECIES: metalloregulator ArsR/SmtB family transcription factor [unclassified Rhizobium]|uniref:metalloregulator ArsR/SmtB family transcription factor n=1 Tax=unclassified Rhizobium TaxID=2613769 RepID=UPI001C833CF6|nr:MULTISPECIES: metalloregulator ArsR/SmtB family transcription factor [unclassified Rhizobium]MBX5160992.1 winged helix-turn-helix transcriptional regulator [Rhizobium sp. NZLR8]MBX5168115.1 winged helix-turn-helix transcriptional regulator [Rhizobium sp. NZLR4b]MBX5199538.1 winged helix-turn-helix transcriptional regulator [Rhizobium sp. NZLR10]MBX5212383.1 winged helix-turn-helix transcriptional regulator [Rhizobium sp. NZLR11]